MKDIIPNKVKYLTLGSPFNSFLNPYESIPSSVTSLIFQSSISKHSNLISYFNNNNNNNHHNNSSNNNSNHNNNNSSSSSSNNIRSNKNNKKETRVPINVNFNRLLVGQSAPIKRYSNRINMYTQTLFKGSIPSSVLYLDMGNRFNSELVPFETIPSSVTVLSLGESFSFTLFENSIPSTVKSLSIPFSFIKPIHSSIIAHLDELILLNSNSNLNSDSNLNQSIIIKSPISNVINNILKINNNKYIKIINNSSNDNSSSFPLLSKYNK